jgi:hypothetical protein
MKRIPTDRSAPLDVMTLLLGGLLLEWLDKAVLPSLDERLDTQPV